MGFGLRIDTRRSIVTREIEVDKLRESLRADVLTEAQKASKNAQIVEHLGCIEYLKAEYEKGREFIYFEELPLYHDHIIGG